MRNFYCFIYAFHLVICGQGLKLDTDNLAFKYEKKRDAPQNTPSF